MLQAQVALPHHRQRMWRGPGSVIGEILPTTWNVQVSPPSGSLLPHSSL